jgi:arylsulfatase A
MTLTLRSLKILNIKSIMVGLLLVILFMLIAGCKVSTVPSVQKPPNIIIIFADDLGYGDLSCYGHPTIRTPSIDKMAAEGMMFTQFYVGANVCTPSRAALLTGRLPIRYGVAGDENRGVFFPNSSKGLPVSEITIAKALKSKYQTGIIGKWHLGHLPAFLPTSHGFDYFFGIPYSNDMIPGDVGWPELPLYRNAEVIEWMPDQTLLTKRYTDEAINFIKKNKNEPFFLYYPNNFPHVPLYASSEFRGKSKRGLYGDVVSELDWSVGRILKTLKEENLDKNTLVIFTSDNGPWLLHKLNGGSAGLLYEGKGSAYEGGMRVPAIAWWPGQIRSNQVCESVATTMDIFPTILKLAGIGMPGDRTFDGNDIWPLLNGENIELTESVFYYYRSWLFAVRKGKWKAHFITKPSYVNVDPVTHEIPLLYDLEMDPSEKLNVSHLHPLIVKELKEEYENHKSSIKAAPSVISDVYWEKNAVPKEWWKG